MSCECYQVGGRFIAEDPDCPQHGRDACGVNEDENDAIRWRKLVALHDGVGTLVHCRDDNGEIIAAFALEEFIDNFKEPR